MADAENLPAWTPQDADADIRLAEPRSAEDEVLDLALAASRDPAASVESEPWEDPVTFDAPLALPPIPTEALPPILAEFVREVAASFEVHTDLPAACVLGVAAAACQKKYRVHVHGDHFEPTNALPAAGAPPGDRKSGVLPFVLDPLFVYEDFLRERDKGDGRSGTRGSPGASRTARASAEKGRDGERARRPRRSETENCRS